MPKGKEKSKKVKFEHTVGDWEWSNKVLKEVIFPELYERYGPNAEPNMQLPAEIIKDLEQLVYGERSGTSKPNEAEASGSVKPKKPEAKKRKPTRC